MRKTLNIIAFLPLPSFTLFLPFALLFALDSCHKFGKSMQEQARHNLIIILS